MSYRSEALEYARQNTTRYENELREFCSIPSVSTLPDHAKYLHVAAEWLLHRLRQTGVNRVSILPTSGHPIVFAETELLDHKPTLLVYGHYDVQPTDPLGEWESPPFEPQVRGECLYARGAADMKAQIVAFLAALDAIHHTQSSFPLNLKFLFEGEEEIGSPSLPNFVDKNSELLQCDAVLNCDGGIHAADIPSITYGLRGLAYFELEVQGPRSDLHSGVFGGAVENPVQVLCRLLANMIDADGHITLPGFYESVTPLTDEERSELARVPLSEEDWVRLTGVPCSWGEKEYSLVERTGARPSLDINGIYGGFTGSGSKTVLPARAMAKFSFRLVPEQRGELVETQLRTYLNAHVPKTVRWELRALNFATPVVVQRHSPFVRAAANALEAVFGKPPLFKRDGGTIPVIGVLKEKLGVDTVMLGFELPDAGFHAPNEHMHLPTFHRGIETYIQFLENWK
ncbi:MAG TPA: dipeptidase [Candidatus Hydrogenedentes bacterium]|nr:dipeptidase [Candidatus Hydrogenedentota bacterium]HOL76154.1 dipeptidase [Candidatus Hydrogenedentota bacterium]HPO84769.1 dipeptidase [Candidatus Hydrogenedentota bacterium]